jgi:hypothetical protein
MSARTVGHVILCCRDMIEEVGWKVRLCQGRAMLWLGGNERGDGHEVVVKECQGCTWMRWCRCVRAGEEQTR